MTVLFERIRRASRHLRGTPLVVLTLSSIILCSRVGAAYAEQVATAPVMSREYLNVLTTYGCYAKSLWHKAEPGGYWGDGIEAKNQNGGVRGMCNTMLTYVMLARGLDKNWIAPEDRSQLQAAGLSRDELTSYAKAELDYLIAHHKSTRPAPQPQWGFHWQSSLWLGAVGSAVLLCWDELSPAQREGIARVAGAEADRIAATPPKDYVEKAGDTGAEENGWNTAALATALALAPKDPRAEAWWRGLRVYAVNTYSHPSDRTSTATVGTDKVSELVSTASLLPDWTMFNHGFFHPDYVQVSGQHLGEAWEILALGDKLHGTKRAEEFRPYALHHVRDVWEKVARPILLPSGEFAFPNGNDWTFHCSTIQSYLAYIATALDDPVAADAEREGIKHVQRRRAVSPPGRLLGDSNLEWWWEPLVCKRACTAMLHHELNQYRDREGASDNASGAKSKPQRHRDTEGSTEQSTSTQYYPHAKVWMYRNGKYLTTASWGSKRMATFYLLNTTTTSAYMALPLDRSILPDDIFSATELTLQPLGKARDYTFDDSLPQSSHSLPALFLTGIRGTSTCIICLPNSVVFASSGKLRQLPIENDSLTSPGRKLSISDASIAATLKGTTSGRFVKPFSENAAFHIDDNWFTIDNTLTILGHTWQYTPSPKWNAKSIAADSLQPLSPNVMQLACFDGSEISTAPYVHPTAHTLAAEDPAGKLTYCFDLNFLSDASTTQPITWTLTAK